MRFIESDWAEKWVSPSTSDTHLLMCSLPIVSVTLVLAYAQYKTDFSNGSEGKESACTAGDTGDMDSILGSGRSPGEGNDNPLQYSCLENPIDRGAWWAIVHEVAKSRT